jgi:hypothetical protein
MRRGRRICWTRILWLAAILIVVALFIVIRLASYAPPETTSYVSPSDAAHARIAVNSVEEELSGVSDAAKEGKRRPFKVSIRQEDVTNFLRSSKGASNLMAGRKVQQPEVRFNSQTVTSSAYVTYQGKRLFVTVTGSLSHAPGKLVFHSDSVKIGKLPAPSRVAKRVDELINAYLTFGKALPARITDVRTEDGQFVMSGVSDPDALRP